MELGIEWTDQAKSEFNKIMAYLTTFWGRRVASEFQNKVEKTLRLVSLFPTMFPSAGNKVRRCVITKHNTLYNRISQERIVVLTIWDNRRNPEDFELSM